MCECELSTLAVMGKSTQLSSFPPSTKGKAEPRGRPRERVTVPLWVSQQQPYTPRSGERYSTGCSIEGVMGSGVAATSNR